MICMLDVTGPSVMLPTSPILRTALRRKWPRSVSMWTDNWLSNNVAAWPSWPIFPDTFGMDPARDAQPDDGLLDVVFCPPHPSLGRCCGRGVPAAASPWITRRHWLPVVPVSHCRGPKRWPSNWMAMLPDCRTRWTSRCFLGIRGDCAFAFHASQSRVNLTS